MGHTKAQLEELVYELAHDQDEIRDILEDDELDNSEKLNEIDELLSDEA